MPLCAVDVGPIRDTSGVLDRPACQSHIRRRITGRLVSQRSHMGSIIKKRRKRMAKKKHRKLLRKTRVARRKAGK